MYLTATAPYFFKNYQVVALISHPNPNLHLCFLGDIYITKSALNPLNLLVMG